jgi:hypothetical protein
MLFLPHASKLFYDSTGLIGGSDLFTLSFIGPIDNPQCL